MNSPSEEPDFGADIALPVCSLAPVSMGARVSMGLTPSLACALWASRAYSASTRSMSATLIRASMREYASMAWVPTAASARWGTLGRTAR